MIDCTFRWLKMNRMNLTLMMVIFLFGCSPKESRETFLSKVRSEHLKDQWKKYQLSPNMTGGGCKDGKLNLICLGLYIKKPLTIETGRRLLIASIQDFMNKVNAFEEFHPYLIEVPFGYDKYKYSIDSFDEKGIISLPIEQPYSNQISYVILSRGELCYNVFLKGTNDIIEILCEPYEEALKIVENEKKEGLEPLDD